jgi:thiosulfate reductase cytochrome b subunit
MADPPRLPRHTVLVRVTHWVNALGFFALVVSGVAILIAHPRLYWGETGGVGTPSLFDLPIPFMLGHSGWGRYLHFVAAWLCVLNGLLYAASGLLTRHFHHALLPSRADLAWGPLARVVSDHLRLKRPSEEESRSYNTLQRLAYLQVVFVLFPLIILTGLAFSPALVSVVPALATVFGGQQSARTIHFFVACSLVLFVFVHVFMVRLAGFRSRSLDMITGHGAAKKEPS